MPQPLSRTHAARSSFAFSYYQAIVPYILLITLLCSSTQFSWALKRGKRGKGKDKDRNLATDIADAYLRSFDSDASDDDDEEDDEEQELTATEHKKAPPYQVRPPKLGNPTALEVLFNGILAKSEKFDRLQRDMEPILNEYAWKDIKLFYGTPSDPGYHLLSRFKRTKTTLGEAVLASFLVMLTSNLEVLRERQNIIKTFLDNPSVKAAIESLLRIYKDCEQSFLSFWTDTDPLAGAEYEKYMQKIFAWNNSSSAGFLQFRKQFWRDLDIWLPQMYWMSSGLYFVYLKIRSKILNNRLSDSLKPLWKTIDNFDFAKFRELGSNFDKFVRGDGPSEDQLLQSETLKDLAQLLGQLQGAQSTTSPESWKTLTDLIFNKLLRNACIIGTIPIYRSFKICNGLFSLPREASPPISVKIGLITVFGGLELLTIYSAYQGYKNYRTHASVLRHLALRMADVQNFIRVLQQVSETIAASPALEKVYGKKLTSIRKLLAKAKGNTELGRLIYYLQHLPFQHWNYFLNNAGKLLASYKLFIKHKDAFADAMYELGQLDTYLSFATLMQESQANNSSHGYTFATFLDRKQKSTPYIKITEMWNPFLDAEQAVGNSIEMDGAPGGLRNMILTGPNAGGKSTYVGAVIICLLLAQTFGILPAQEGVLTLFKKLCTFIQKGDDVAEAQSLFMAEATRAQKHINTIKGLKSQEFSFTIFDELFSGTNPKEGAAAEYGLLYTLGAYSNSLSIVATHYPTVMQLEEKAPDRGFVNYKVYITRDENGKIHYTYQSVPGQADQAIALELLKDKGFDSEMMQKAQEVLNNPDQYNAEFKEETGETRDLVQYKPGDTPGTEEDEEDEEDLVEYKPEGSVATKD